MAEGFARHYGDGVIEPSSAGLFPASIVQPETFQVMAERGVILDAGQKPRSILLADATNLDILVNMTGQPVLRLLNGFTGHEIPWEIVDPIGMKIQVYRQVRDQIEQKVKEMVEQFLTAPPR